jgi:DNA polymerase III epsilon subunit-like protein
VKSFHKDLMDVPVGQQGTGRHHEWRRAIRNTNAFVIDLETGGLSPKSNPILEIGFLTIFNGRVTGEGSVMVTPGDLEVTEYCRDLHSKRDFSHAVGIREALAVLSDAVFDYSSEYGVTPFVIGHNFLQFDARFLQAAAERCHLPDPLATESFSRNTFDTQIIARPLKQLRNVRSVALARLAKHFGIGEFDAHTALGDCKATAELYAHLLWYNCR